MAITVNNLQNSGSDTLAYTPASVTDSCLVVFVSSEDVGNNEAITGVSFGATSMALEVVGQGILGSNSNDIAMAYLVNPGTSAQTITVTGGQHDRMGIVAITLDNVDQSSPVDVSDESFETTSIAVVPTSATTTNDNSFVVSGSTTGDGAASMSAVGATEILEFAPPSSKLAVGTSTQTPVGAYTHTWTSTIAGRTSSASIAFNLASGAGEVLIVDSGSYSLTGTVLSLSAQLNIITTAGSYSLTGAQSNLITARRLLTDSGSYNLTGTDVTLIYTPSGGGDVLIIDSGVYSLAGDDVILRADLSIIANSGDYSLTGTNTSVLFNGNIAAESNAYLLIGTNVNVFANYGIIAQTINYSLTGSSVTLKYSGDTSQTIGVVTSGFAVSLYSSGFAKDKYGSSFKPNITTVNFKG